jgi:CBS domain-containing protein
MRLQELTVSDLMKTTLVTLHVKDTLQRADLEMRFAGIRHLLVVDDHNHVIGIISNRDLFRAFGESSTKALPVSVVMTTGVCTARPETSAREAAALMLERKIGALPVTDEADRLVGILTETDFLALVYRALGGVEPVELPVTGAGHEPHP